MHSKKFSFFTMLNHYLFSRRFVRLYLQHIYFLIWTSNISKKFPLTFKDLLIRIHLVTPSSLKKNEYNTICSLWNAEIHMHKACKIMLLKVMTVKVKSIPPLKSQHVLSNQIFMRNFVIDRSMINNKTNKAEVLWNSTNWNDIKSIVKLF